MSKAFAEFGIEVDPRSVVALGQIGDSFSSVEKEMLKIAQASPRVQAEVERLTAQFLRGNASAQQTRAALLGLAGELPATAAQLRNASNATEDYLKKLEKFHQHAAAMRREVDGFATFGGTLARGFGVAGVALVGFDRAIEHASTRLAEFQRLQRVQGELGVNFAQAQGSTRRFTSQMDVAALAEHFASAQVNLDQRQLNALTGGGARLAQMQGTSFEMQAERLFSGIVGGELEVLRRFGPEMAALSGQTHTAQERLEAFIRTARNLGEATDDAATSVERMKENMRMQERSFLHGFHEEARTLAAQDGPLKQLTTQIGELNANMGSFGATSARVLHGIVEASIRWQGTLSTIYGTLGRMNPLVQAFERAGGGRFARDVRAGEAAGRAGVMDLARRGLREGLNIDLDLPAERDVTVGAVPAEFAGADTISWTGRIAAGEGMIGGTLGGMAAQARAELVRRNSYTQAEVEALSDSQAMVLARSLTRHHNRQRHTGRGRHTTPAWLQRSLAAKRDEDRRMGELVGQNREAPDTLQDGLRGLSGRMGTFDAAPGEMIAAAEEKNVNNLNDQLEQQRGFSERLAELYQRPATAAQQAADGVSKAFGAMGEAFSAHLTAVVSGREALGEALQGMLSDTLSAIGKEASVKAGMELGMGFGSLFFNPAEAASHFTAAGIFTGVAVAAGLAGAATAPSAGAGGAGGRAANDNGRATRDLGFGARGGQDSPPPPTVINYYAPVVGGRESTDAEAGTRLRRYDRAADARLQRPRAA